MDEERKSIIKSILRFLRDEIKGTILDAEQKECIDVARQCLENTYEISDSLDTAVDLSTLFNIKKVELTEEVINKAEAHKSKGNDFVKTGQYNEALEEYNKAIELNPRNAVYYCNRAAAYSRLEKHKDSMSDCRQAIKLDPTYVKAYGRLGIAYSNMNMYKEAKEAYAKALQLDPNNTSYEENLKLAEERLQSMDGPSGLGAGLGGPNFDFSSFMNNPALLNMASQMLSDPAFRQMVTGIMGSNNGGDRNIDAFMQLGQQFAQQMQSSNPNLIDNLRQSFGIQRTEADGSTDNNEENDDDKEKKE